jgi:hypothetical protein
MRILFCLSSRSANEVSATRDLPLRAVSLLSLITDPASLRLLDDKGSDALAR